MSIKKLIFSSLFFLIRRLVKLLFSLRYKVSVRGFEHLERAEGRGVLILPNHPAEIDPVMLMLLFWERFHPKPLVVEPFYYLKGFHFLMRWVGALALPNIGSVASKRTVDQVALLFRRIVAALKEGESFLIYPAGKLKLSGQEKIGGASFVPSLLQAYPEAQVILVRTTGLWGSRFSRGVTKEVPNFRRVLWEGAKILLKNGIFFTPRRKVVIEVEEAGEDFPAGAGKREVNRWLEQWYNRGGSEPLTRVSDRFWARSTPPFEGGEEGAGAETRARVPVSSELERAVIAQIAELSRLPVEKIHRAMELSTDLGLDSLDRAQIAAFLEERFDRVIEDLPLETVEDLLRAAEGVYGEAESSPCHPPHRSNWPLERDRPPPRKPEGETLVEAFLRSVERMGGHAACADRHSGVLSYRKLKQVALTLALHMRALPGENVGVLLPSSSATYLVILALLLAKKRPVLLNWTTGGRVLVHVVKATSLQRVLSSGSLIERLRDEELGGIREKLLLLEHVRKQTSFARKVRGALLSLRSPAALLRKLGLEEQRAEDVAAIIFTSGTEALPKGVPLSHRNILSNQAAALQCVNFKASDVLYGVLPPFHSFGFAVTGLLPLLVGLRAFYAPDPTNSRGMARDMCEWQPTLVCSAPSFVRNLLRVASSSELATVRLFVLGAEKTAEELYRMLARVCPGALAIEGYGITECAPIVTLQRPSEPQRGVGKPLPGVLLRIHDIETLEPLPVGEEGEIYIAGPNLFSGYLEGAPDPFVEREGQRWYRSGDKGSLDAEGNLFLSGRLKRFVKIGGEMVSLGAIEQELSALSLERHWISSRASPSLAVGVREQEGQRPLIVVYATFNLSREQANDALKERGFSKLARIADVVRVEEIPLTGAGKIDYRQLDGNDG